MGGIFYNSEAVRSGERIDLIEVARISAPVHGNYGASAGRNFRSNGRSAYVAGERIDIGEDGHRALHENRESGGHKSLRRKNHFVAGANSSKHKRKMQR